jgi:hypothetical protein
MTKLVKIPFTGLYNTRVSVSNAAGGASGVIGIGVIGIMVIGGVPTSANKDEQYINCFLTDQGGAKYIIKRPGMAVNNTPQAGSIGTAILVWTGLPPGTNVVTAFGALNSTIYRNILAIGTITGRARWITETFVTGTPTLFISSGDSSAWYYDVPTGVVTKVVDADYPGNAGFVTTGRPAHMDGFVFVMDTTGRIWNSDLNSVTSWSALSFVSANTYPDLGVGVMRYKNQIMAFGTESIQFYFNAGNPVGSPLQRVETDTVKVGAINQDSIGQMIDTIYWVGSSAQGGCTVYQYDGSVQRISFPEQDYILLLAGPQNISLTTLRVYGRSLVMVIAGTTTLVYVVEDKRWHQWNTVTPLWFKCAGLSSGPQILTFSISNQSTSGSVFIVNPAALVFTDNGLSYTAVAQSRADDFGTSDRKFFEQIRVVADTESMPSNLTVSYSDDDFMSFVMAGTVDLSLPTPRLSKLGSSHKRAWKLVHTSNTAMRIERCDLQIDVGQGYR